jgi:DNA polymerase III alpha subunit (gram-positive type)
MVDIETTGTSPDHAGVIQISAVRFNLTDKTVDNNMFDKCLWLPPMRYWEEDTRAFWAKHPRVLQEIIARGEEPGQVMRDFASWVGYGGAIMWAKPNTFEFPLLSSYFKQFDIQNPFHYRYCTDVQSYVRGRGRDIDEVFKSIPFEGDAHNALHDVLHQIRMVFEV